MESSLRDAIYTAPLARLQRLLLDIIDKNGEARDEAIARLLKPITGSNGKKRKAYETCVNCNNDYDVGSNTLGVCVYHEGEREYDDTNDFWADHDPNCHGEPDDLMDDSEYDEGYTWNCCQQTTAAEGCVKSRHTPKIECGKRRA
ncbi:hypothetical protein DOTSEDRAFT_139144 [Dothistroma septosporum NZE10]|uniref:C2H2-type domain-containing protein n=1 Tax=Dothistroma septosporum (strain NZE10 / CBS 128990) TaxID=675120 RepID=M2Y2S5_DOTSN|nr:hypothetical protein DOTSEDRAFT_139144 [Dothistroma septosporum NZE10]